MNDQEELLQSWINMEFAIRGNRVLSELSFNEVVVCHSLLRAQKKGNWMTAAELCDEMQLLKSQMNRLLGDMEQRGLISRTRSDFDRRKIDVQLCEKGLELYQKEHSRILEILTELSEEMGEERLGELAALMNKATDIAERIIAQKK